MQKSLAILFLSLAAASCPAQNVSPTLPSWNEAAQKAWWDFGIEAGADTMIEKLKDGDWDGARLVYERTIRDFGEQGGLTLYLKIVRPYVEACLQNDKLDLADRAISFTEDRMTIDLRSQVGQSFSDLKNEVAARRLAEH